MERVTDLGGGVKSGGRTDTCSSGAGAGCGGAAGNLWSAWNQRSLLFLLLGQVESWGPAPRMMETKTQCLPQVGAPNFKTFWRGWDAVGNGTCPRQLVLVNGEGGSRADRGGPGALPPIQSASGGPVAWAWVEGGRNASKT